MQRKTMYFVTFVAGIVANLPAYASPSSPIAGLEYLKRVFVEATTRTSTVNNDAALRAYLKRRAAWGVSPAISSERAALAANNEALATYLSQREAFGDTPSLTSAQFNAVPIEDVLAAYLEKRRSYGTAPLNVALETYLSQRERVAQESARDPLQVYLARRAKWGQAPSQFAIQEPVSIPLTLTQYLKRREGWARSAAVTRYDEKFVTAADPAAWAMKNWTVA